MAKKKLQDIAHSWKEAKVWADKPTLKTGLLPVDYVFTGGISVGRAIELYGKASCGKTTLSLYLMGKFMKDFPDKKVMFIDAEFAFAGLWAQLNGVDIKDERFQIVYPEDGNEILWAIEQAVRSGDYSFIVLDSIGSLYFDGEFEVKEKSNRFETNTKVANIAKVLTPFLRKMTKPLWMSNTTFLMLNHMRQKINTGGPRTLGDTVPGGTQKEHMSTYRIKLNRLGNSNLPGSLQDTHVLSSLKSVKNKGGGHDERYIDSLFIDKANGIDRGLSNMTFLQKLGLCEDLVYQKGSYYYVGDKKAMGKEQGKELFVKSGIIDQIYERDEVNAVLSGTNEIKRNKEYKLVVGED